MSPRIKEQVEKIKENTKEKIQNSAVYLFSKKGLSVKISEIANHANISQGLLYRYYASKTDLIIDLVKNASEIAVSNISGLANLNMPAKDKINMISEMMINMLKNKDGGANTFLFMMQAYLNMSEELVKIYSWEDSPLTFLAAIVEQGQSEGTVKDGDKIKLSCLYWAAVQGLCYYFGINSPVFPDSTMLSNILLK